MIRTKTITSVALAASALSTAFAGSYLPKAGERVAAFSLTHTTFNEFWAGSEKQPGVPGGGEIERTSYRSYLYYGLQENLSLDLSFGYADVSANLGSQGAFTDSTIGLSWQLSHQEEDNLDWMVRAGINLEGDYDVGALSAPGDGENGFDLSTKLGTNLGSSNLRGDIELGYTFNDGQVPDSYRFRVSPTYQVNELIAVDVAGTYFSGRNGIDIGGEGFSGLGDLPRVEERGTAGEVGISFNTDFGYYRLSASRILDGRNIGEEVTVGLFGAFNF